MRAVARVVGRAGRAVVRPEVDRWHPDWHVGEIRYSGREGAVALAWLMRHRRDVEWLHGRLFDDESRRLLVDLLAHRLTHSKCVAFGPGRERCEEVMRFAEDELIVDRSGPVPRFDLTPIGLELTFEAKPLFAVPTFLLEQYRHATIPEAGPHEGDHAIDGGAYWGDTALWLAAHCGPDGVVTAFEIDPANLPTLESNLRANGAIGRRVRVRREALWDSPGKLVLDQAGPASSVESGDDGQVTATTVDLLVDTGVLERVDFIKLDVEGAELRVLRGAEQAIRRWRPRLALAAYHHWDDVVELPRWLASVVPDYRFALAHNSLHQFDTTLFAWPSRPPVRD